MPYTLKNKIFGPLLSSAQHWARSDWLLWPAARFLLRNVPHSEALRMAQTADGFAMNLRLAEYPDGSIYFGVYEVRTVRLIRSLLSSGDAAVDVGANIGYLTFHMAKAVTSVGRVVAIEPHPGTFHRLEENVRGNGFRSIELRECAAGDSDGELVLYGFEESSQARHALASLRPLFQQSVQHRVQVRRLDDLVPGRVKLVKIDVEGAEVAVLKGASSMIRDYHPHLIVECNNRTLKAFGHTFRDVVDTVLSINPCYELRVVGGGKIAPGSNSLSVMTECNVWFRPTKLI